MTQNQEKVLKLEEHIELLRGAWDKSVFRHQKAEKKLEKIQKLITYPDTHTEARIKSILGDKS